MKLYTKNKIIIELSDKDYLNQGGEAVIYAKGNTAYKIYHEPKKIIPLSKIQELSALTDQNIIRPLDIIYNSKNTAVGYSMRYVKDTYSLCSLFPKAFKERSNISHDTTLNLIRFLQNLIQHIHQHNILIVDLNELNFLSDKNFKELYAIDTDSYQTPSFPATAIMDSVRDLHSKTFNENTDWFSFAIVSCQLFLGIHPYKGKYTKYKTLEERMVHNVSIFNKNVSVPSVVYPFSVIPNIYLDWYKAVLDDGKRLPPPFDLNVPIGDIIHKIIKQVIGSDHLDINEIKSYNDKELILNLFFNNGNEISVTNKNVYINKDCVQKPKQNINIGLTPKNNHVIFAYEESNNLKLYDASKRSDLNISLTCSEVTEYQNRIYCKSLNNIIEINFSEINNTIFTSAKIIGTCLEQSSHLYDGVLIQNLLGDYYISLFPQSGTCYQLPLKELKRYKIINAKFDNNILMILGTKSGKYDKLILRFSPEYDSYDVRIINDIDQLDMNFIVLDNGVCVHLVDDEKLEIFSNKKDSSNIKEVNDKVITSDTKLFKNGTKVLFAKENKIYSMKMK